MPRAHPPEFRQRAVELARLREKPLSRIKKDLRISHSCLRAATYPAALSPPLYHRSRPSRSRSSPPRSPHLAYATSRSYGRPLTRSSTILGDRDVELLRRLIRAHTRSRSASLTSST